MKTNDLRFLNQLALVNHAEQEFHAAIPQWIEKAREPEMKRLLIRIHAEADGRLAVIGCLIHCFDGRAKRRRMRCAEVVDCIRQYTGNVGHSTDPSGLSESRMHEALIQILDSMTRMYSRLYRWANQLQKDVAAAYLFEILEEVKATRGVLSQVEAQVEATDERVPCRVRAKATTSFSSLETAGG